MTGDCGTDRAKAAAAGSDSWPPLDCDWPNVIAWAASGAMAVADVARLAESLAASGETLALRSRGSADLASTGGPTSLSTLLCPLMLAAAGWEVPKLGVPGRPAGGVDVLAGIDGYRVSWTPEDAVRVLDQCRYVHLDAGTIFAPADASLFRHRQAAVAQAVPDLAIASLLSKKLAMNVRRVGLEARVAPHGNFGRGLPEARAAAARFVEVASVLGLDAVCVLTDATRPFQPFVGRGEALLALRHVLDETEDAWLAGHLAECANMAALVGGSAVHTLGRGDLKAVAAANIEAQGGSVSAFHKRAALIEAGHTRTMTAVSAGRVDYDLGWLRSAIVSAQGVGAGQAWPDDAGAILLVRPGELVELGDPIMSVRCPAIAWPALHAALAAAVRIGHAEKAASGAILEVVGV